MLHDTKIALVLRSDLAGWQVANVAAFLAGGLVGARPELPGFAYMDADGTSYAPLVRQPILIFGASSRELARTRSRALSRGSTLNIYTAALFATGNDADNRAAVAAVAGEALDLVGLGVVDERRIVDKIVNGLKLFG